MLTALKLKIVFIASLFLLLACNSNSKEKTADKKQTDTTTPALPISPSPNVEIKVANKKCFSNDGLKYKTVVTLLFGHKEGKEIVSGNVTSGEIDSGKPEKGVFEGTIDGDKLMIKFIGNPPIVGDASEWTDKPWTLKKVGGKETLHIIFNAKNYDTNKWKDTDYQFELVDCK
jgi:hypothetical protein